MNGATKVRVAGRTVEVSSPGVLEGDCATEAEGLVARCTVGRGKVTVIADADFLNVDDAGAGNLQMMLAELARIEP